MTATLADQIAAKEAELEQAHAASLANSERQVGGSSRRIQFVRRIDAQIRRAAAYVRTIEGLERELAALKRRAERPDPGPVDLDTLVPDCLIRTDCGWYRVVKVNRATVKVAVRPGMDDLIKKTKILAIRHVPNNT